MASKYCDRSSSFSRGGPQKLSSRLDVPLNRPTRENLFFFGDGDDECLKCSELGFRKA